MNIDRERSRGRKGPSDATYGAKTHKEGHTDWFFGYDVEALVRVPLRKVDDPTQRPEPILLERLLVLPASTDIVDPCLRMIDSLHDAGGKVRRLLVDRHYSYKLYKRWLLQLHKRGVRQVCDLHEKDQGFRDWDGMKMAAAWPHCPATPDHLGTIPSLPPNATQAQVQQFTARIGERQAYAAQRIGEDLSKGITRWSCPARNGTIGCPLREGTVATAIANGLPVVVNPPGRGERPTLCRQRTVQITTRPDNTAEARVMKPYQKHYWGTQEWRRDYNRRTFVEGWFGVLKNDNATGLDRGSHQFRGLPLVTLVIACAAAINNMRLLRTWHTETQNGDLSHPLVQADETFHGYVQLTQLQAAQIADDARTDAA